MTEPEWESVTFEQQLNQRRRVGYRIVTARAALQSGPAVTAVIRLWTCQSDRMMK
jgi:hypothetical protein